MTAPPRVIAWPALAYGSSRCLAGLGRHDAAQRGGPGAPRRRRQCRPGSANVVAVVLRHRAVVPRQPSLGVDGRSGRSDLRARSCRSGRCRSPGSPRRPSPCSVVASLTVALVDRRRARSRSPPPTSPCSAASGSSSSRCSTSRPSSPTSGTEGARRHDQSVEPAPRPDDRTRSTRKRRPRRRRPSRVERLWRGPDTDPAWARPALFALLGCTALALPVGPRRVGLGELVLLRRGAGRHEELEGVLLRLHRRVELRHRRQDPRVVVGHGAVGARLRRELVEHPRTAGARRRRRGRHPLRHGQALVLAGAALLAGAVFALHAGGRADVPVQQPRRAAGAAARGRAPTR